MDNEIWVSLNRLDLQRRPGNVQQRAKVGAHNINWKTTLQNASRKLCCHTAEDLLDQEADTNSIDGKENTNDMELLRHLVEDSDMNEQDRSGNTRAHLAIINKTHSVLKLLLKHSVKLNLKNSEGMTPLHVACLGQDIDIEIVDLLLKSNAAVNIRDNMGKTPLHDASFAGAVEVVRKLLAQGANFNAQDHLGMTPLHMASTNRNKSVVKVLLKHGASVNLRNSEGHTPLHIACLAVEGDNLQVIDLLLDHVDNIDVKSSVGNTPLHLAVLQPNRVYEKLINRGACVDEKNNKGETPYDLCFKIANDAQGRKVVIVEKHILKLKTAGIQVDVQLRTDIDTVYEQSKQLYLQEVEKMRLVKINNLFSLDTVFFTSKILGYLRNSENLVKLENQIYSANVGMEFPLYKQLLKNTFEKTILRVDLLEQAFQSLNSEKRKLIWSRKLPDLVKYKIFDYLSNEDLKKLIESG